MNSYLAGCLARISAAGIRCGSTFRITALVLLAAVAASASAFGQLSGTYTIGGAAPSYATIDAAITALNAGGVSGPVTFLIRTGTYTPPSGGYTLQANAGMSATNTVTFKPDVGASVTISGTTDTLTAVFTISGGKHYVLDGSNVGGGTSRDMLIRQTRASTNPAVWMVRDADHNTVKNCVLVGAGEKQSWSYPEVGQGVVGVGLGTATAGNDSNLVENNLVGDTAGVYRSNIGIAVEAPWNTGLNKGNRILRNDVVNFGRSNGPYSIGILVGGGDENTLVEGNEVHMTVRAPAPYLMGIAIAASSGVVAPGGTVINANRIHHLTSDWTDYSGYAILEDLSNSGGDVTLTNNMISLVDDGDFYLAGILTQGRASTVYAYHNSIYIGGTAPTRGTRHARGIISNYSNYLTVKNNIIRSTRTGGNALNAALYINDTTNYVSDYNIISFNTGARYFTAYLGDNTGYGGTSRLTFNDFQSHTLQDQHSFEAATPFTDAANGDLHIDPAVADTNGDKGTPIADVTADFDADQRDAVHPDIGADELPIPGVTITYPNGGEKIGVEDTINVAFTANRPLNVRVDFSADGGATWTNGTPRDVVQGANAVTITAPNAATARARVRVVNTANVREADGSDRDFEVVQPVLTMITPNGGDTLVPTDHARIEFTARYLAASTRLWLEYSADDGATWNLIDTSLRAAAYPAATVFDWLVPTRPTARGRVRIMKAGTIAGDTSDAAFRITELPAVALTAPITGTVLYTGEKVSITWSAVATSQVRLTYSTDDGATWLNVVSGGLPRPAEPGAFSWVVPNTPAERVLLKITNAERVRFSAVSGPYAIRRASVQLTSPNGGERYEPGTPVTVTWSASNTGLLRLEYSADNARSWRTVASGIAPETGSYSFTPAAVPTRFGLVRLTDPLRQNVSDVSDSTFEVLAERNITILAPTAVDVISRNQPTEIVWSASRVAEVDISYSTDDGATWKTVATGVPAPFGSHTWDVPDVVTEVGRIRVGETGGGLVVESGPFSIVARAPVSLRVLVPNGGETYRVGETVPVRWSASGIETPVEVSFSSDAGATWTTIARPQANAGTVNWSVMGAPSDRYRIRVMTGNIIDVSDSLFTVLAKDVPTIDLVAPNGGERLAVGSIAEIRWSARNLGGDVAIEFSADGGAVWSDVLTVPAASGSAAWTVPDVVTDRGLIRVTAKTSGATDRSAAPFSIVRPGSPIVLLTPNGGERWLQNTYQSIRWSAPAAVNLEYSVDAGATWASIATNRASVPGANEYRWLTPGLSFDAEGTVLVRATAVADATLFDISDAPFSLLRVAAGVDGITNTDGVTGRSAAGVLAAYPNPSTGRTEIRWNQRETADAELRLYDGAGRLVGTFNVGRRERGPQRFELHADGLASGPYVCELRAAGVPYRTMLLLTR